MAKKKYRIKARQAQAVLDGGKKPRSAPKRKTVGDFPFGKRNFLFFGIGLIVIIAGFIALTLGDITLAPILLVVGYCVLIPIAILADKDKEKKPEEPQAQTSGD